MATLITLLAAHVLADFLLQPRWLIRRKHHIGAMLLHIAVVAIVSILALGPAKANGWLLIAAVAGSHAVIDLIKTHGFSEPWLASGQNRRLAVFFADQVAHIVVILIGAWLWQDSFADGYWSQWLTPTAQVTWLSGLSLLAGLVLATRAGGFVMTMFMARFAAYVPEHASAAQQDPGLPNGGAWIGWLERTLVFAFILAGQFSAIGLLIAGKSILRFQYARERSQSEIVIIGTMASFAWAMAAAGLTQLALRQL